jgi:hypothetical protein
MNTIYEQKDQLGDVLPILKIPLRLFDWKISIPASKRSSPCLCVFNIVCDINILIIHKLLYWQGFLWVFSNNIVYSKTQYFVPIW